MLLGGIEEIVRRGRVRGFIPWLITQRPTVVHKDVLSQADILVAMKLTSSQDRDAIGGWIEGQADRAEGKRILADLPRLARGQGYLWAPGHDVLARVAFPAIATFDSSRSPRCGERVATPPHARRRRLARRHHRAGAGRDRAETTRLREQLAERERELDAAHQRIAELETGAAALRERLGRIAALSAGIEKGEPSAITVPDLPAPAAVPATANGRHRRPARTSAATPVVKDGKSNPALHPAARKLLAALAQYAPGRFTWGQAATLAGLKPSGGHFNAGRKKLRAAGLVDEAADLVTVNSAGMAATDEVPPVPSSPAERLALWSTPLPSPAPRDAARADRGW